MSYHRNSPHHYPPLAQAPEAVTNVLGMAGLALALGFVVWLSRGGIEKLHERETRRRDWG